MAKEKSTEDEGKTNLQNRERIRKTLRITRSERQKNR